MNSEFPMTFIEPESKLKGRSRKSPALSLHSLSSEPSSAERRGASIGRKKVIPISHRSLAGFSQTGRDESSAGNQKNTLYPMSEFEESGSAEGTRNYQRSPLRFFRKLVLTLSLGALWIAIGTGELRSDSPSVVNARAHLSAQIPALSSLFSPSSVEHSDASESIDKTLLNASSAGEQTVMERLAIQDGEIASPQADAGALAGSSVDQNETLDQGSLNQPSDSSSSLTHLTTTAASGKVELTAMLDLFLEQGRQMQKMENHLLEMVKKNDSPERYSAFMTELKKRHAAALEMMEGQR
jgi:hypothetical protein